jgi:hypothetical protein
MVRLSPAPGKSATADVLAAARQRGGEQVRRVDAGPVIGVQVVD